ncbi:MAG: FAD-dependent oxidoreductase [Dehalobacterium sp.]
MERINNHPILQFSKGKKVTFSFEGQKLEGYEGEPIAASLHAAGIRVLHESAHMNRARGFFCAIGNCSSCLMKVDGVPNIRVCVELLREGMFVQRQKGKERPELSGKDSEPINGTEKIRDAEVVVIGGGPAGLSAALTAADYGVHVTVIERDKHLGGQLVKQTHKFFGSEKQRAGIRGIEIAKELSEKVSHASNIDVWKGATAVGYFPEGILMVEKDNKAAGIKAHAIIMATGGFERMLVFPNNDLPGIYGAGAVQTLMNVHGIVPGQRVIMVGAGNIGLIVSYQLLQAGVDVAAIVEAGPRVGGYEVHEAKVRRAGVPIYLSHTIKEAYGTTCLEGASIWRLNEKWQPVPGTEKIIEADVMCLAVGLSPLVELAWQASCKMKSVPELGGYVPVTDEHARTTVKGIYAAGDAGGIEEASSAMINGQLAGLTAANDLGYVKEYAAPHQDLLIQLHSLRSGPAGAKILRGLNKLRAKEGEYHA